MAKSKDKDKQSKSITLSKIFFLIVSIMITIFFFYTFFQLQLVNQFAKAITKNVGDYRLQVLVLVSIIFFLVLYSFGFFLYALGLFENKFFKTQNKVNLYSIIMLSTMLYVLIIGVIGYSSIYNQQDFTFVLRDNQGRIVGNITCNENSAVILQGQQATCKMNPILSNLSAKIQFDYSDTNYSQEDFSNLSFYAPYKDVYYFKIYIKGINSNSENVELSVSNEYYFPNVTDYRKDCIDFLKFFFILLGVIFITIPTAMYYIREIIRDEFKASATES
jgi:hypothetical protein